MPALNTMPPVIVMILMIRLLDPATALVH